MTTLENANDGIPDDAPRPSEKLEVSQKQNVEQTVKSTEDNSKQSAKDQATLERKKANAERIFKRPKKWGIQLDNK
jgi:hypothetical protein